MKNLKALVVLSYYRLRRSNGSVNTARGVVNLRLVNVKFVNYIDWAPHPNLTTS